MIILSQSRILQWSRSIHSYYEEHHPTPNEVYLLIEVADSTLRQPFDNPSARLRGQAQGTGSGDTLKRDRELKAPAYAQSGIQDYWILDVNQRQLYVFRSPTATGYANEFVLSDSDIISPLTFLDCQIAVVEMLRKQ